MGLITRDNIVVNVENASSAFRAGIGVGDIIRGYNTFPLARGIIFWEDDAITKIDAIEVGTVVSIQVKKKDSLSGVCQKRRRYIDKQRVFRFILGHNVCITDKVIYLY